MYSKYMRFGGKLGRSRTRTVMNFKYITTKLSGKALDVIKHRDTSKWANLKRLFKSQNTAANSQHELNSMKMHDGGKTCHNRVEELFCKFCNISGTVREEGEKCGSNARHTKLATERL